MTYIKEFKNKQAARFLTVGFITFACEYLVFYTLYVFLNWDLLLSNSLSFAIGLSVSFILNRIWAFKQGKYQRGLHHQAAIYVVLALSNLVINNIIVAGLKAVGVDPRIGKIVAIGTIAIWNFLIYRHIIFREKLEKTE